MNAKINEHHLRPLNMLLHAYNVQEEELYIYKPMNNNFKAAQNLMHRRPFFDRRLHATNPKNTDPFTHKQNFFGFRDKHIFYFIQYLDGTMRIGNVHHLREDSACTRYGYFMVYEHVDVEENIYKREILVILPRNLPTAKVKAADLQEEFEWHNLCHAYREGRMLLNELLIDQAHGWELLLSAQQMKSSLCRIKKTTASLLDSHKDFLEKYLQKQEKSDLSKERKIDLQINKWNELHKKAESKEERMLLTIFAVNGICALI